MISKYIKNKKRLLKQKRLIIKSPMFDETYYRAIYSLPIRTDAAEDYCRFGWKEGKNPSPFFDTNFYLRTYDDVRLAGMNPLVHFLTGGAQEFRQPSADFDVYGFKKDHPDINFDVNNIAEFCISKYGTYAWKDGAVKKETLSDDVIVNFRDNFDADFYRSMNVDLTKLTDPYSHFLLEGQYQDRDPSPSFDIHYYRQKIIGDGLPNRNPVYHYSRHGKIQSASTRSTDDITIEPVSNSTDGTLPTLCVHAHCFYPELLGELIGGLQNLPPNAHVVVTVTTKADLIYVKKKISLVALLQTVEIRLVQNRGRDLAPFLIDCSDVWRRFDVVLHVHTKRSTHIDWGDQWRKYLLDQTLGSDLLITAVLARFKDEPELSCMFPRNFHKIRRDAEKELNDSAINSLLLKLGVEDRGTIDRSYAAGSVAWYRSKALYPIAQQMDKIGEFELEKGQIDSTVAHALERVLPYYLRATGGRVVSYITPRRSVLKPLAGFPERESSRSPVSIRWRANTAKIAIEPPLNLAPRNPNYRRYRLNIHWILPSFARGAGGHMTIFRIVNYMERFGHFQTLWIQDAVQFADQNEALSKICQWYKPIGCNVHVRFLPTDVRELAGDVVIATDVWTMFPASRTTNFKERFQFVQDDETIFFPAGEQRLLAETTNDFGFSSLCAGAWLLELAKARGSWARSWSLCADHDTYYPGTPKIFEGRRLRIAFYARPYTPRRATGLGLAALELLHNRGIDIHVDLFGEANLELNLIYSNTQHGILSPAELGELYRDADIGLVFSATNYSLVPLEMMACELPVVELNHLSTRAIFKNDEVTFALPTPYGVADAIELLMKNPDIRANQIRRAASFVRAYSWETSARTVESAIVERLEELHFNQIDARSESSECAVGSAISSPGLSFKKKVSVVIPTCNAGSNFENVLEQLVIQKCDFRYEVLVIDSESEDETLDITNKYSDRGVRVEQIRRADFQHGRTRNQGMANTNGDYVAFLTQDATPKNSDWLAQLIGGFTYGPRVAGVIGRHEAYPEHDAFIHRDISEMFDGMRLLPNVFDYDVGLPSFFYPGGRTWRMLMHFYSDNNSAMSREVWKILPYPEIDWGEDQVWADEMLRLGFQKSYVDSAVVLHSHNLNLEERYKLASIEGAFWGEHFGLDLHPNLRNDLDTMNAMDRDFSDLKSIDGESLRKRILLNKSVVEGRKAGYISSLKSRSRI